MDRDMQGPDHGARRLEGAMLEHAGLAIERMPGLGYALNRFMAVAPQRLSPLIAHLSGGAIEEIRPTTLLQAIGDCSGLTAAIYESAEPEARLMIALDERIDRLIVSSIFGEVVDTDGPESLGSEAKRPRTPIEAALLEAFARALGRRDGEAASVRFSLGLNGGGEGLLLLPQAFLIGLRAELARDPEAEALPADRRWSQLMEVGVRQTRLPVTAVLEEVQMSLGDVARFRAGALLPLQCKDFTAIRLDCSGRGMFACKLGEAAGRYRLEVESPIEARGEATP